MERVRKIGRNRKEIGPALRAVLLARVVRHGRAVPRSVHEDIHWRRWEASGDAAPGASERVLA